MSIKIKKVQARQILDSRGNPTVEVDMHSTDGLFSRAAVPSGASTGAFEAHELRDGDEKKFLGKGVKEACLNVNQIFESVKGKSFESYQDFDSEMIKLDGSANKEKLGANAILSLSLAFSKLEAAKKEIPYYKLFEKKGQYKMPVPLMNLLNGGAHSNNGLDIQEFMIVPKVGDTFFDAVRAGAEIFQNLKKIISDKSLSTAVGDEGGFAPELNGNIDALDLLMKAIENAGYKPGEEVFLALDVAATEFYNSETEVYNFEGQQLKAESLLEVYQGLSKKYPIISIEDGFAEEDWTAWSNAVSSFGNKMQLVGDDLFVTNVTRIERGIKEKSANALLVKPNQIGTVSETVKAVELMHKHGFKTIMSHRSGETEDVSIAHLCLGLGCSQIKTGSLCRSERTAKYNELIRIEETFDEKIWHPLV